jgi:hypothetical protein
MPVDYQQIHHKIKEIGAGARQRRQTLDARRKAARDLLRAHAADLDSLRMKVDAAKLADPNLRCALPVNEPLDSHHPAPDSVTEATLIAADGSQVNPDRHAAVQFCVVNVGAITMRLRSGTAPEIHTSSELLFGEELETLTGPITEGMVALRRDLKERSKLDELAAGLTGPVVTFTDGPIELWGAKNTEDAEAYAESVQRYLEVLRSLQSRGVITAGYVDKPSADLVLRLLEIAAAGADQLPKLREFRPLRGVSDRWLYGAREELLLPPGHRSAVFGLQSGSEKKYTGVLALHFFYLNVGTEGHPWPVRVEIPKWVADDKSMLDLLHSVLISQCRMLGSKPYPYLLHRAHETAVVTQDEKFQVEQMIMQEMRRNDEEIGDPSNKGATKALPGRKRM